MSVAWDIIGIKLSRDADTQVTNCVGYPNILMEVNMRIEIKQEESSVEVIRIKKAE